MVGRSLTVLMFIPLLWSSGQQAAAPRKDAAQKAPAAMAQPARAMDLIVDVLTRPNKFWNKTVTLKAHVVSVKPDPPGTNRGTYLFRDSSDRDIDVQATDLPAVGTEFFVYGTVLQLTIDTKVPVVHEDARAGTLDELERKIKDLSKK